MSEIDLTFLQRQQQRILHELAEVRLGLRGIRDDNVVLMTMLRNFGQQQQETNSLMFDRLRKLEER